MRPYASLLLVAAAAAALAACGGPRHEMTPPEAFKRYEDVRALKLITADGVMLKAREVENYPKADLPFWTDAMKRHLEERGYVAKSERCFDTAGGRRGCTIDFLLPRGAEDWVLSETLFVVDDRVVLVEAAGPYDRFAKVEADLAKALETFRPGK